MGILTIIIQRIRRQQAHLLRPVSLGLAIAFVFCLPVAGQDVTSSTEQSLKSAFIFNFAKYVEWPDSALRGKGEFCIATLGRSSLDKELAALNGKIVQGRSIVFRRLGSPEEAAHCQVLFISRSELPRLELILDHLGGVPVLTVADHDGFSEKGGMLSLVNESGKIVFDVNILEMRRAGLKPNPQLLRLARKIYGADKRSGY